MTWKSDPLWAALADMRIGSAGAACGFAARLARENGWSAAYAGEVAREYRRFLYIAARTDKPVTPSDEVDQAWHLHLLNSRHYWDILCGRILQRPFHHDPAGGGAVEALRHRRQYQDTLAHYRKLFGEDPPPTIWPASVDAFALRPIRVDSARYWLVPKLPAGQATVLAGAAVAIAACSALAANRAASEGGLHWGPIIALIALGTIVVAAAQWLFARRRRRDGDSSGSCSSSCGSDGNSSSDCNQGCGGDGGGDGGCGGGGCGGGGD